MFSSSHGRPEAAKYCDGNNDDDDKDDDEMMFCASIAVSNVCHDKLFNCGRTSTTTTDLVRSNFTANFKSNESTESRTSFACHFLHRRHKPNGERSSNQWTKRESVTTTDCTKTKNDFQYTSHTDEAKNRFSSMENGTFHLLIIDKLAVHERTAHSSPETARLGRHKHCNKTVWHCKFCFAVSDIRLFVVGKFVSLRSQRLHSSHNRLAKVNAGLRTFSQ